MLALRLSFAFFRWRHDSRSPRAFRYRARRFGEIVTSLHDASERVKTSALHELLQDHQAALVHWARREIRRGRA